MTRHPGCRREIAIRQRVFDQPGPHVRRHRSAHDPETKRNAPEHAPIATGDDAPLAPVLGPQHDVVQHHRALPHREVALAIEKVRAADPAKVDTLAFEFLVLRAARSGEVRGAAWSEIDRDARVWSVPASRMKTARAHRVPLCGRALEILDAARRLDGGGRPVVFVNERGKSLGSERLTRLLKGHRIAPA